MSSSVERRRRPRVLTCGNLEFSGMEASMRQEY
jgi:hypothetical protein